MVLVLRECGFYCSRFTCRKALFALDSSIVVNEVLEIWVGFEWFQWKQRGV